MAVVQQLTLSNNAYVTVIITLSEPPKVQCECPFRALLTILISHEKLGERKIVFQHSPQQGSKTYGEAE